MKIALVLVFLSLLLISPMGAQEWSAPLSISNVPGPDTSPDFCIDSFGVMHCVWSHVYNVVNHKKVFYSKSTDSGNTWTQAILISEDSISVAVYPIIRCDSQNNLFVAYSYGSGNEDSQVHIRKFDGTEWSEIFNVGESLNPVSVIDMVVDNNDLVYIFIYYGGTYGYSLYRSWNGSVWSDLVVLYDGESYNNSIYIPCFSLPGIVINLKIDNWSVTDRLAKTVIRFSEMVIRIICKNSDQN